MVAARGARYADGMKASVSWVLIGAASVGSALVGCGPAPQVQTPVAPVQTATAGPAPAATGEPAAAEPEVLATEDGLVRVLHPQGEGWKCKAEHVENAVAAVNASYVQCRRKTAAGTVSLMAKDYQVPRANVMTAEALSTVEYPKHYKKSWVEVQYTKSGPIDHHGYPGYEVVIELGRPGSPGLHLVERVVVVERHTLNLSADAPPDMWASVEADVSRWFAGAEFGILRLDPKMQALIAVPEDGLALLENTLVHER
jgi:hypothetical protein